LQGLVGWIMVQSGLNEENLYVSHIRLSIHFLTALVLLVYTFWFALSLSVKPTERKNNQPLKRFAILILGLLTIQLAYGAFMAGLKAAIIAPTWPDINGSYSPAGFFRFQDRAFGFFSALINNPLVVQFIHRNLAYVIFILVVAWTIKAVRVNTGPVFSKAKWLPLIIVSLQLVLGIASILTSPDKVPQRWGVFEWNALTHQFVAMLLLLSLVFGLFLLSSNKKLIQP
jgi:cytochrome c oxidase assembly protein subunit 15